MVFDGPSKGHFLLLKLGDLLVDVSYHVPD